MCQFCALGPGQPFPTEVLLAKASKCSFWCPGSCWPVLSSPLHCRRAYVEPGQKTRPLSWRCGPGVFRILTLLSSKQDSEGRCLVAPRRPVAMRALRDSRNRRPQPRPTEAPGGYRMPQASSKDPGGQWIRTPEGAPPRASPPLCPGQRCAAHARLGAHPPRQGGPG